MSLLAAVGLALVAMLAFDALVVVLAMVRARRRERARLRRRLAELDRPAEAPPR